MRSTWTLALLGALVAAAPLPAAAQASRGTFLERMQDRAEALRERNRERKARLRPLGARGVLRGERPRREWVPTGRQLTRYPVVLHHGIGGFGELGPIQGFRKVPQRLRDLGCRVLVTEVAAFGTVEQRARQLRDQILAVYPDPLFKVNIVAHSMGGLDARAMIARYGMGDRVASLTTLSTPHRGSPVADAVQERVSPRAQEAIDTLMNRLGWDWDCVRDLTTAHTQSVFNPTTPDDSRVYYQSYAAHSVRRGQPGAPTRPLLWRVQRITSEAAGPNDGLVALDSARWGHWRGTLPTDHIGLLGYTARTGFDHLAFYTRLARDLADMGF